MPGLDEATQRLNAALDALKTAALPLAGARQDALNGASQAQSRIAGLESERQGLLARIAELEEELAALSGLSEEVEGRLDGAIGEIRAALAR